MMMMMMMTMIIVITKKQNNHKTTFRIWILDEVNYLPRPFHIIFRNFRFWLITQRRSVR